MSFISVFILEFRFLDIYYLDIKFFLFIFLNYFVIDMKFMILSIQYRFYLKKFNFKNFKSLLDCIEVKILCKKISIEVIEKSYRFAM